MKQIILITVVLSILYGCEKDKPISYSSNIVGEWSWLSTCGGFSGLCSTPQSTHITFKLEFTKDSVYSEFQNDTLISSSKFHLHKQVPIDSNDTIYFLQINSVNESYLIIHDTLSLQIIGADFGSAYKRIK
jgi:hypothetical protein